MKLGTGVIVFALLMSDAIIGGSEAAAASVPTPTDQTKNIYIYASGRDHALLVPSWEGDFFPVSWEGVTEASPLDLLLYLNNPRLFPKDRPTVITVFGKIPDEQLRQLFIGARNRGFAFQVEEDALAVAARNGPAEVVYYSRPEYRGNAESYALVAKRLRGARFVVVGSVEDYDRLDRDGAIIPNVVVMGDEFPVADKRPGWLIDGAPGKGGMAIHAAGIAQMLSSFQEQQDELLRLQAPLIAARAEQDGSGGGAGPGGSVTPVDVAFYTPYGAKGVLDMDALAFYDSKSLATDYYNTSCTGPSGSGPCHPNLLAPIPLDFENATSWGSTLGNCGEAGPINPDYNARKIGWINCRYPALATDEANYFEQAIRERVEFHLAPLRTAHNITTVTIVSHWLDIPYRQKLFPYQPLRGNCGFMQQYCFDANGDLVDSDHLAMDADNDEGTSGCQTFTIGPGPCAANLDNYPGNPPINQNDDAYEGDSGMLDFFLADYHNDGGSAPYAYAHAGVGRLLGHTTGQVSALTNTAKEYLEDKLFGCPAGSVCEARGAVIVQGGARGALANGLYNEFLALTECRYGSASSTKVKIPCEVVGCANEVPCGTATYDETADLLTVASTYGELVHAAGHNIDPFKDNQQIQFFTGCAPTPDPYVLSSRKIYDYIVAGGSFPAGIWSLFGSNCSGYAFQRRHPCAVIGCSPCDMTCMQADCAGNPHNPCFPGCTTPCLQNGLPAFPGTGTLETSFVSSLITGGAVALFNSVSGHGTGTSNNTGADTGTVFNREVVRGTPIGRAYTRACNVKLLFFVADPQHVNAYEIGMELIGDPTIALPNPMATCNDAPVVLVSPGDAPDQPVFIEEPGLPHVRAMRADTVPMDGLLDFFPHGAGTSLRYGSTVATGEIDLSNGVEEIGVGKGAGIGMDSLVKVFYTNGVTVTGGSFFTFGTADFGVNLDFGDIADAIGAQDVVVAPGPGTTSSFAPAVRTYVYNGFSFSASKVNFFAYPSSNVYGANVSVGPFNSSYALDEITTGPGPGPAYGPNVKTFRDVWANPTAPPTAASFNAFGGLGFYGATVGKSDIDGNGVLEILVGHGSSGGAVTSTTLEIWRNKGFLCPMCLEVSFEAFPSSTYPPTPGVQAGARTAGIEILSDTGIAPKDELIAVRGPASHVSTDALGSPPHFQGSHVRAFDVDYTTTPWTVNQIPLWSCNAPCGSGTTQDPAMGPRPFFDQEPPTRYSTYGGHVAKIVSTALTWGPYTFREDRRLLKDGNPSTLAANDGRRDAAPGGDPVWPWLGPKEVAGMIYNQISGAPDVLFEKGTSKDTLKALLDAIMADLDAGAWSSALDKVEDAKDASREETKNTGTEEEILDQLGKLKSSIEQQVANTAPVALIHGEQNIALTIETTAPFASVYLWAGGSTDVDSSKGTNDNIRHYRWSLDGQTWEQAEETAVRVGYDPNTGEGVHVVTLEVEDAYGAWSTAKATITVNGPK